MSSPRAWYIWYRAPVSKAASSSSDSRLRSPWAPNAPAATGARRLVEHDGDGRPAGDLGRHAAPADPVKPARRRYRHRDEVSRPGFGLDEDLARWVAEAHDPLHGEASQARPDAFQIARARRFESRHLLVGVDEPAVLVDHVVRDRRHVQQTDDRAGALSRAGDHGQH